MPLSILKEELQKSGLAVNLILFFTWEIQQYFFLLSLYNTLFLLRSFYS